MKNKNDFITIVVIAILSSFIGVCFAAQEITSINANWISRTASINVRSGNFQSTNKTLVNGDILQTTVFVPDGGTYQEKLQGSIFSKVFGALVQSGAVNMDAVTNMTMGITGVPIAGTDITNQDFPAKS